MQREHSSTNSQPIWSRLQSPVAQAVSRIPSLLKVPGHGDSTDGFRRGCARDRRRASRNQEARDSPPHSQCKCFLLGEQRAGHSNGLTLFRRTAGMRPSPARRGPRSGTTARSSLPALSRVSTRCCRSSWPIRIPAPSPRRPWWMRLSGRASSDSRRASGQGN